jgi:hypothetical protein
VRGESLSCALESCFLYADEFGILCADEPLSYAQMSPLLSWVASEDVSFKYAIAGTEDQKSKLK